MAETFARALVATGRAARRARRVAVHDRPQPADRQRSARAGGGVGAAPAASEPLALDDRDIQRIAEIAEAADLAETVRATLSATEYEALHARVVEEESYAELALRLQCSEAVARKRVSRAIAHVRTAIGDGND